MFVLLCSRLLLLLLLMCVCTCVKRSDFNDSSRIEMLEYATSNGYNFFVKGFAFSVIIMFLFVITDKEHDIGLLYHKNVIF